MKHQAHLPAHHRSKLPASWTMDYHIDGQWKTFVPYTTDHFNTMKDQFNMVHPDQPIKADAIRLNIVAKKDACVGILEVAIE